MLEVIKYGKKGLVAVLIDRVIKTFRVRKGYIVLNSSYLLSKELRLGGLTK